MYAKTLFYHTFKLTQWFSHCKNIASDVQDVKKFHATSPALDHCFSFCYPSFSKL